MSKLSKFPSTPEIDAMKVSRQRKIQLRAVLAGVCGTCFTNPLSPHYPTSGRCEECREKFITYVRGRTKCKTPQPHRMRPRCDEILAEIKDLPPEAFSNKGKIEAIAAKLDCPPGYIVYLRSKKLGIKFKRGRPRKNEENTPKTAVA